MRDLDPFDASILNVLAQVPEGMDDLRKELLKRLEVEGTEQGKKIAHAILAEEAHFTGPPDDLGDLEEAEDVRVTAASLRRAVGIS